MNETVVNTEITKNPLVTFALFSYNQEKYIREAVEGAFSQDYEQLEIILSDDSSTDRTFEIMQEMAEDYQGPHKVRVVRQIPNLGTVNHLITVSRMAKGEIFIVNAGDDISYPNRTTAIVNAFLETDASCVNSHYDEINEIGDIVCRDQSFPYSVDIQKIFIDSSVVQRTNGRVEGAIGFAASYRRSFWSDLPLSSHKLLVEDGLATVIINCLGARIVRLNKSLIAYRIHDKSLSLRQSRNSTEAIYQREKKIDSSAKEIFESIDYSIAYLASIKHPTESVVLQALRIHQNYGRVAQGFWKESIFGKFERLRMVKSKNDLLFVLPRILGKTVFVLLKRTSLWLISLRKKQYSCN